MKSLERRILAGLAVALLVLFGFLFWASAASVRALSESYVLTRLEHDAEALLSAFGRGPRGPVRLREGRITPVYQQPLSGHYFMLLSGDANVIRSRSLWDETLPIEPLAPGTTRVEQLNGPDGQRLLARTAGYRKHDHELTLLVAEDMTPTLQRIQRFQWLLLGSLAVALAVILLTQRYILRRGFVTLDQVRDDLRRVAGGEQARVEELGPTEIRPLTVEVNRLLQQLQQRLQRSRQALGNLAHALKSPLSLLMHDVESLPLADDERRHLAARMSRISQLIERELKRARIASGAAGQHFRPAEHLAELIEAVTQLYRERDLSISSGPLPGRPLPFDYEDMLELIGNLLDNACKWAQKRVRVELTADDGLHLRVADDGPGVADEARESLLQRGSRLDEQEPGHGLGLAIVRDLVADYGGTIHLGRSADLGGLEVSVDLPFTRHDFS